MEENFQTENKANKKRLSVHITENRKVIHYFYFLFQFL